MPTKIHNRPKNDIPAHAPDGLPEHDLTIVNKNLQHREALRLALGSILTPKRPYSPSRPQSRSSSGTASPALSFPFPSVSPPPPSAGTSPNQPPPIHGHAHGWLAESHLHSLYMHPQSHHSYPHTPSRLGILDSTPSDCLLPHSQSTTASGSPVTSSPSSPVIPPNTNLPHPHEPLPRLPDAALSEQSGKPGTVPTVHLPEPMQPTGLDAYAATGYGAHCEAHEQASGSNGSGTPKAKFIETLQSKSAWDALIHGSFS